MSYLGKLQIDSNTPIPVGSTLYGTASITDSANYPARYVTGNSTLLANVDTLLPGLTIHVRFSASNSVENPTLKVGSTNAKPIHRVAGTAVGTTAETSWPADSIVTLTYDDTIGTGGAWVINSATDINTTYTFAEGSTNGAFSVTPSGGSAQTVSIHGLGSAAYTDSSAYATAAQGDKADAAMPKDGGQFTGNVSFASGKTLTVNTPTADGHAATKLYVDEKINQGLGAADAMVFKGTLGTGGTITAVPDGSSGNTYRKGWTYRVITAGTYAGVVCEVGDLLIALVDSENNQSAVNNAHWTVAQTNIDGAVTTTGGTNGYIAKFTGTHSIANLIAITQNGTGFLKEDGSWATPTNDRDPGYGKITPANNASTTTALTGNTTQVLAKEYNENIKFTGANKWIVLAGSNSNTAGSDELKFGHYVPESITNSGPSAAQTGTRGSTFNIPKIAVDAAGHVTGITSITVSLPASDNTDEKVAQSGITTDGSYAILLKHSTGTSDETQGVNFGKTSGKLVTVNPSTGIITAAGFSGTLATTNLSDIDTNATTKTFLHKSGAWKTLGISNTTTTIASIANGVLTLKSTVSDSATLTMT